MEAILDPIGEFWEGFLSNPIVQLASQLIVIYVVLLWLGTAYWAFRDMQARTENPILPYFAAALIIFFTPLLFMFAVILYLNLRPLMRRPSTPACAAQPTPDHERRPPWNLTGRSLPARCRQARTRQLALT